MAFCDSDHLFLTQCTHSVANISSHTWLQVELIIQIGCILVEGSAPSDAWGSIHRWGTGTFWDDWTLSQQTALVILLTALTGELVCTQAFWLAHPQHEHQPTVIHSLRSRDLYSQIFNMNQELGEVCRKKWSQYEWSSGFLCCVVLC
jgi:hypothetical protein